MRAVIVAFLSGVVLAVVPAQAAPTSVATSIKLGAAPPVELMAGGGGPWLAPPPLARPLGILALGWLRS
jgi:hypothetical protein